LAKSHVPGSVLQGRNGRRACHLFHCGGMILLSERIEGSCELLFASQILNMAAVRHLPGVLG